jgi:hypothetical protein
MAIGSSPNGRFWQTKGALVHPVFTGKAKRKRKKNAKKRESLVNNGSRDSFRAEKLRSTALVSFG